jgi:hypothetical protein
MCYKAVALSQPPSPAPQEPTAPRRTWLPPDRAEVRRLRLEIDSDVVGRPNPLATAAALRGLRSVHVRFGGGNPARDDDGRGCSVAVWVSLQPLEHLDLDELELDLPRRWAVNFGDFTRFDPASGMMLASELPRERLPRTLRRLAVRGGRLGAPGAFVEELLRVGLRDLSLTRRSAPVLPDGEFAPPAHRHRDWERLEALTTLTSLRALGAAHDQTPPAHFPTSLRRLELDTCDFCLHGVSRLTGLRSLTLRGAGTLIVPVLRELPALADLTLEDPWPDSPLRLSELSALTSLTLVDARWAGAGAGPACVHPRLPARLLRLEIQAVAEPPPALSVPRDLQPPPGALLVLHPDISLAGRVPTPARRLLPRLDLYCRDRDIPPARPWSLDA